MKNKIEKIKRGINKMKKKSFNQTNKDIAIMLNAFCQTKELPKFSMFVPVNIDGWKTEICINVTKKGKK